MLYSEVLNIVNERIRQGRIFSKIQYVPIGNEGWRDYILFLQPTIMKPNEFGNFSPAFSVLLDGEGRPSSVEEIRGGLGLSGIVSIEDLTTEDFTDFANCLKRTGFRFNRKLNIVEEI